MTDKKPLLDRLKEFGEEQRKKRDGRAYLKDPDYEDEKKEIRKKLRKKKQKIVQEKKKSMWDELAES